MPLMREILVEGCDLLKSNHYADYVTMPRRNSLSLFSAGTGRKALSLFGIIEV